MTDPNKEKKKNKIAEVLKSLFGGIKTQAGKLNEWSKEEVYSKEEVKNFGKKTFTPLLLLIIVGYLAMPYLTGTPAPDMATTEVVMVTEEVMVETPVPTPVVEEVEEVANEEIETKGENMDAEQLKLWLVLAITVGMEFVKRSRKNNGKALSTAQVNYILIAACAAIAYFWGDAIGVDFPAIDLKNFLALTDDLDGTLFQLVESIGSLFGPAVIGHWALKSTAYKLLPKE